MDTKMLCQRLYASYEPYESGNENSVFILAEQMCIVETGEVKCFTAVWWSVMPEEIVMHVTAHSLFDLYVTGDEGRNTIDEIKRNIASAWSEEDVDYMKKQYPKQYAELTAAVKESALMNGCEIK